MTPPRRLAPALWLLLGLFFLRVAGQLLVVLGLGRGLPPMEEWYSGLLPYRFLLPAQILILLILGKVCVDYTRNRGLAARPRHRLGNFLIVFGSIYLAVMVLRYGLRMALYPPERWTGGSIPIFLHWVLATFLLLVGRDQRRRGTVSPRVSRGPPGARGPRGPRRASARTAGSRRSGIWQRASRWLGGLAIAGAILAWVFLQLAPSILARSLGARRAQYAVRVDRRVSAKMRDGVTLFADVYRPRRAASPPTILIRMPLPPLPRPRFFADLVGRMWAERGYRTIIQVTRGTPPSEGERYPLRHERSDGLDTLAWLAKDPAFDGRLGMWGGSSFGHTQWVLADQSAPGPSALFIWMASSDFHSMFHHGGAFSLESALFWAIRSRGENDAPPNAATIDRGAQGFPLIQADDRAAGNIPFFDDWARHGVLDDYWIGIDGIGRPRELKAPVLLLAGWFDPFLPGQLDDFRRIRAEAADRVAAETRLVIGPWAHATSVMLADGFQPRNFRIDSLAPALSWFDRHVSHVDSPSRQEPRVRIFVMGENVWRDEEEWPPRRGLLEDYYLRSRGDAAGPAARGRLETLPPVDADPPDVFLYDPNRPVPTAGGAMLSPRAGVARQNAIESRPDVLSYTTESLDDDLEVTGPVRAVLYVTTSAPQTDFTAKLVDVHPDGSAYNVCDGILRRSYPERMPDGTSTVTQVTIELWPTSMLFRRGHRIRLEVSSSNHPRFDANSNVEGEIATQTRVVVARQAVHHGAAAVSRLILPVISRSSSSRRP